MDNRYFEQMILDSSNDFYYFCGLDDYNIQFINQALCDYLDIELDDCVGKKCYNIIYDRTAPCLFCVNEELRYDTMNIKSIETTYKLKDSKFKCAIAIIENDMGKTHMTRYIIDDVSELHFATHTTGKSLLADNINELLIDLFIAIEEGEFLVYFQPKFRFSDEKLVGAEALARRCNPKTGKLSYPSDFIPVYEKNSLTRHIDLHILDEVCKVLSNWISKGKYIKIDVNFSYITLIEHSIVEVISGICDKYGVPHNMINIEISDNKNLVKYEKIIKRKLEQLIAAGFTISLDNFCFEFSTLNTVINTDISEVKFGRALILGIDKSKNMQVALKNIIDMCNNIKNVDTLALCVETKEEAECVRGLAPTNGQGFYFSDAIFHDEFYEKFLNIN